jgi:hypothetical protein
MCPHGREKIRKGRIAIEFWPVTGLNDYPLKNLFWTAVIF